MGHNDFPLAVEGDVSIVSVDAKLRQLSHHLAAAVQAHLAGALKAHLAGPVQAHAALKCCLPPSSV